MTTLRAYVRARGDITCNGQAGSIRYRFGDKVPADHWSVQDSTNFEPVAVQPEEADILDRLSATRDEMAAISARNHGAPQHWPAGQRERYENLTRAEAKLRTDANAAREGHILRLAQAGYIERATPCGDEQQPGYGPDARRSQLRTGVMRMVEQDVRTGLLPTHAAERMESLLALPGHGQANQAARWATVTGSAAYRGAFIKLLADPTNGHRLWTAEEADAFRTAEAYKVEARAMGIGTDAGGGYLLPFQLDPAILLTSNGSTNPLRQVARVVTITSDEWHGITSAGATAEWKAEAAEVTDGSPTLAQPTIPVHFGDSFVPYSFELGMDGINFLSELQAVLLDAADQLMATAYMRGTGTGQPAGVLTGLSAGQKIASTTADTIVAADVVKLQNALPPRFQPNAQFLANLATINTIGSFETSNGSLRFPEVATGRLLNRPLLEASTLDTAGTTAAAGNDNVILYGDFNQFVIVDRIGTTLELIPHLVGANRRPTGQRAALLWFRTGSKTVIDNAFRLLTA